MFVKILAPMPNVLGHFLNAALCATYRALRQVEQFQSNKDRLLGDTLLQLPVLGLGGDDLK